MIRMCKITLTTRYGFGCHEMRLTREMLDIVPREKHESLCSLDKLQQILKSHIESKRVLLILDDVWDDMNYCSLDLILAPFKSNNANGNVILVTTRYLSVAKRIGTTEPVVLHALGTYEFWLLFKARAFRDDKYEGHVNLINIGRKIADKLKGNPLAAVTAGELLRVDLTVDHWIKILKDEDWKLLGLTGGIMSSLKLSYDHLPYHLHQCFSYCSIFSDNHPFLGEELVDMWISQGFVKQSHPDKRLEEIGMEYLADLVDLGYFEKVGRQHFPRALGSENPFSFCKGSQVSYVVSGLMHDFARMASRDDCAIIDGLQNNILPTVQHLSVECKTDQHGNLSSSSKFKEYLRNTVTSMRKLRTLLLIGQYDCSFFQFLEDIFQKAHDIRLLQISATFEDLNALMGSSVNPTHLRYLKLRVDELREDLPQVFSKCCHLQVLDVGSNTYLNVPHGMNNLVSLRHLGAASVAGIGKLTSLQKLSNFKVKVSNGFQIIELQSMKDLVIIGISHLQNVKTREEAHGAGLLNKWHLERLHLSWNMSDDEHDSDDSDDECESVTSSEPSTSIETEEGLPTEVLEGLEPRNNLKHLQISRYNGATSPSWLASNISVTSLQTLHLVDCGEWRILPSLEGLPFLAKLKLSTMPKVKEVSVPSLEELVLTEMPKLERCSCISLSDLNSGLRVLTIEECPVLKVFDLFGNGHKFNIEQKSWLPRLCELTLQKCGLLVVPHPLPSSRTVCSISVSGVSMFPIIEGSSCGRLTIANYLMHRLDKSCDELLVLDGNILAFHNLRFLTELVIDCCKNLMSISFKGLSQLESLTRLEIRECPELSSFDASPEHAREDLMGANCISLPSLEYLEIMSCGIAWECLSLLILQHAPALKRLVLSSCPKLESLQLYSCASLEKLTVWSCESLGTIVVLQSHSLSHLEVRQVPKLESLLLHSCTALEELGIYSCASLRTLEGFQSLSSLRRLYLRGCPGLHSCLEGLPVQEYVLCPRLEFLCISDFSFLATSFCKQVTSLQHLFLWGTMEETEAAELTEEQERRLLLLGSLTELTFRFYNHLKCLPAGLHRLRSLQVLVVSSCPSISGLPELPPSLEELRISDGGSEELKRQSKSRASSKLKVAID